MDKTRHLDCLLMNGLNDVLLCSHCCTHTRTHSSSTLVQACLSKITLMSCRYLCYWEAVGAITPSSGCFNSHEKNMGALRCTHCTSSMTVVPPVSFLFHIHAHGPSASPELHLHGDPSATWVPSQFTSLSNYSFMHWLYTSVQTCNWFLCIEFMCSHWSDQPLYVKINGALKSSVDNVPGLFIRPQSDQIQRKCT